MISQSFQISKYDWKVVVFYNTTEEDVDEVRGAMLWCGAREHKMSDLKEMVSGMNTGITYSNLEKRKSVVVISRTTSGREFLNTFDHEKCHLTIHICKTFGINPYSEEMCYISGNIAETMFDACHELVCDCCRRKVPE